VAAATPGAVPVPHDVGRQAFGNQAQQELPDGAVQPRRVVLQARVERGIVRGELADRSFPGVGVGGHPPRGSVDRSATLNRQLYGSPGASG